MPIKLLKCLTTVFVIGFPFSVFSQTKIVCQSEIAREWNKENWSGFFSESPEVTLLSESKAYLSLRLREIEKIQCEVDQTTIRCIQKLKTGGLQFELSRITGNYEMFITTKPLSESRIRGFCAKTNQLKF